MACRNGQPPGRFAGGLAGAAAVCAFVWKLSDNGYCNRIGFDTIADALVLEHLPKP